MLEEHPRCLAPAPRRPPPKHKVDTGDSHSPSSILAPTPESKDILGELEALNRFDVLNGEELVDHDNDGDDDVDLHGECSSWALLSLGRVVCCFDSIAFSRVFSRRGYRGKRVEAWEAGADILRFWFWASPAGIPRGRESRPHSPGSRRRERRLLPEALSRDAPKIAGIPPTVGFWWDVKLALV